MNRRTTLTAVAAISVALAAAAADGKKAETKPADGIWPN
jgi:hypothetical protein